MPKTPLISLSLDASGVIPTFEKISYDLAKVSFVARMKREIHADAKRGLVPYGVQCFGDLDDHRDANCYGGFCEDKVFDMLKNKFRRQGDSDDHMPDAMFEFIDECRVECDRWIKAGGLRELEGK